MANLLPSTAQRVAGHTSEEINRNIRRQTEEWVRYFAEHPTGIDDRLGELDREWDIERALGATASSFSLAGLLLGITLHRRWLLFPAAVNAFLLQHSLQGWCPPVPVLRRLGVRTVAEIDAERNALKALRGDYRTSEARQPSGARERADAALDAARA